MIFRIVELLAHSPIWLGLCGFGVIVVPMLGLQYIYEQERRKGGFPPYFSRFARFTRLTKGVIVIGWLGVPVGFSPPGHNRRVTAPNGRFPALYKAPKRRYS